VFWDMAEPIKELRSYTRGLRMSQHRKRGMFIYLENDLTACSCLRAAQLGGGWWKINSPTAAKKFVDSRERMEL